MNSRLPNLVERAAEQLLKSGNLDSSVSQLLNKDATAKGGEAGPTAPVGLQGLGNLASPAAPAGTTQLVAVPFSDTVGNAALVASGASAPPVAAAIAIGEQLAAPAIVSGLDTAAPERVIDMSALERAGMIDWGQARSRISEEFRIVQRQVLRNAASPELIEQGHANLIMLTSARPGEGKSFVALNMASGIARQKDHDVLLVDIDYKHDSIGTALGLSGGRGLLDLVTDPSLDPEQVIVKTGLNNLSILPIGQHAERSPELFASRQATRLIQSLGRRYADRLVILDAPPCLATSEPGVLASIVGQIIMVVEAEKTQREEVEASMDIVHACPTITLLLNKAQVASRFSFGAYASSYAQPYTS